MDRRLTELHGLLAELRKLPREVDWVEFKHDNATPEEIGEYLSALSNAAALAGKVQAYLVWGIDDATHDVVGTRFDPASAKVGNEELESWLLRLLSPRINFRFHVFEVSDQRVVLLEIGAAFRHPVQFRSVEFIRIGTYKKKLKDFPEKERELWHVFDQTPFEREVAAEKISGDEVLRLLDYPAYFELLGQPLPEGREAVLAALDSDGLLAQAVGGWNITNLGAILFAKRLADFRTLQRKAVRVVLYKGNSRVETVREQEGGKGYATGFQGLIDFVTGLLPSNEVIGRALRKQVPMFPALAIRELIANAMIHQDFHLTGTGPMVEIFADRMEITNPGLPLVQTHRFLDSPPGRATRGWPRSCAASAFARSAAAVSTRWSSRPSSTSCLRHCSKPPTSTPAPCCSPIASSATWTRRTGCVPVICMPACVMFSAMT
ncbi:ATP-dependent DNA helicase RecG [Acidithiobacillus thiooxidans ATCC 19377]|uniref:ATP-dependent DNA helicase RecG n=1 Tax=Acidithiobacillus thiooxidans ATCC 19377 TaxID=637390 RepID=A0A543Q5R9_ACITH|nr:RNA-binding domain-containing protein [Acidithiobacillus thiooxidans]MDX5934117.1 putative DNA binding domain-containing protein [Acidithiobacillus thiooxidans]TQN51663.1 ATP-dependent DNA helicase RecG [Acidithiobacillus thiooxidans ATCC 19377]